MSIRKPLSPERLEALARARVKAAARKAELAAVRAKDRETEQALVEAQRRAKQEQLAALTAAPTAPKAERKAQAKPPPAESSSSEDDDVHSSKGKSPSVPGYIRDYYRSKSDFYQAQAESHRSQAAAHARREAQPMTHEAAEVRVARHLIKSKAHDAYRKMAWASLFPGVDYTED